MKNDADIGIVKRTPSTLKKKSLESNKMLHRAMQHHVLRIGTLLTQSNKGVSINDAHIYLKKNIDVDLDFNLQIKSDLI